MSGGSGNDILTGNSLGNVLAGNAGNDTLTGGAGNDFLFGELGNDTYVFGVASAAEADTVIEVTNAGTDTLDFFSLTTALTVNLVLNTAQTVHFNRTLKLNSTAVIENVIGGSSNDTLTGNSLVNRLTGNAGNDMLTGGAGNDSLIGGLGDDRYVFDTAMVAEADIVTEVSSQGTDTLDFSSLTTALTVNLVLNTVQTVHSNQTLKLNSTAVIENVLGGSSNDSLTGNSLVNVLTGNTGNDMLTGGAGDDSLIGGLGDDTYVFSVASASEDDTVTEAANAGTDTLDFSTITTTVNVNLRTSAVQTVHDNRTLKLNTTNTFENVIVGADGGIQLGNGILSIYGRSTADFITVYSGPGQVGIFFNEQEYLYNTTDFSSINIFGYGGNDRLGVIGTSKPVAIYGGLGNDQIVTSDEITIGAKLYGEDGNDTLVGGGRNGELYGGKGDDTYRLASLQTQINKVFENENEGTDTLELAQMLTSVNLNLSTTDLQNVYAKGTLKLNSGSTFENAVGGTGNDTLIGNSLDNALTGNKGHDVLVGNSGADELLGGAGRDILIGGNGLDTLDGDEDDDILIAGRTSHDALVANLNDLRTGWIAGSTYAARITSLRAGVGGTASSLKKKVNVVNDAGENDSLTGGTGTNWYFRAVDDVITDLFAGETIDLL